MLAQLLALTEAEAANSGAILKGFLPSTGRYVESAVLHTGNHNRCQKFIILCDEDKDHCTGSFLLPSLIPILALEGFIFACVPHQINELSLIFKGYVLKPRILYLTM